MSSISHLAHVLVLSLLLLAACAQGSNPTATPTYYPVTSEPTRAPLWRPARIAAADFPWGADLVVGDVFIVEKSDDFASLAIVDQTIVECGGGESEISSKEGQCRALAPGTAHVVGVVVYPCPNPSQPPGCHPPKAIPVLTIRVHPAATPSPSKPPSLVVWSRWSVLRPPPPEPKVNCLWHGANLLIWDNGRVLIRQPHPDGGYDILSGQLDGERMRQLTELIKTHGLRGTATPARPNPAGNYADVGAKVDGDNYALDGDTVKLLTTWLAQDAAPYVPPRAWLTVEPYPVITSTYYKYLKPEDLPVWPGEQFGFALSKVPSSGREIEGQAAAFVWHEATSGRSIFTGFREGTAAFAVFISFQQSEPLMDSMFVPCRTGS